eukprot:scaffold124342_cov19-Tisochrysis_lutea.AAC.1
MAANTLIQQSVLMAAHPASKLVNLCKQTSCFFCNVHPSVVIQWSLIDPVPSFSRNLKAQRHYIGPIPDCVRISISQRHCIGPVLDRARITQAQRHYCQVKLTKELKETSQGDSEQ